MIAFSNHKAKHILRNFVETLHGWAHVEFSEEHCATVSPGRIIID